MKTFLPAVLAVLFLSACARRDAADAPPPLADIPLPVVVAPAATAPFERAATVQGTLEAVESAVVSARVPGPLLSVCVDLGDPVIANETVLFEVDPATVSNQAVIAREAAATARARVAVAEATVRKAAAVARKAALDADRFSRLHDDARVSDNEWEEASTRRDAADADLAVAEASLLLARQQVSQAEAQQAIAERQLADAAPLAPVDGFVDARLREPGEQVGPGVPVVSVKGTAALKARGYLPADRYPEVVPGETPVEIRTPGAPPVTVPVAAKSPAIDPRLRVFEFKALLPGAPGVAPGARADLRVVFERRTALAVPEEAVLRRAAGTVVFLAGPDGAAREVPVRVGLRAGGLAEILEGLAPGDPVVVQGQSQLSHGRKISLADPAPPLSTPPS